MLVGHTTCDRLAVRASIRYTEVTAYIQFSSLIVIPPNIIFAATALQLKTIVAPLFLCRTSSKLQTVA
ncbi:uncharacterized protein PHACADRAFT_257353 [Phanerochaete carnosa HHB-10118-sp]|uniref:Uncharacterized protein n=1 Tax=Phanerochaete carnosa (strain HHB-10118-sp) TaxID=650164 RepID=K5VQZ5_PHACS|nr:uncharacterized protein PHACADRAFT_257353 [Phanerochaete carnosa HHB-10118-sp]EKM53873.1 hypothetical protein PHACADRAFT_257353 [Phanerochaete carnosa HHB-10118-sp]